MAILSTAKIVGMLASAKKTGKQILNAAGEYVAEVVEDFMSGFAGYGWKIWEYVKGKWMLEIDSIRVREQFIVFEMLVSKMRAIIGSLGISQACGKIATVTLSEDGTEYLITLEDETMSFVAHDFMRCQTYAGTKQTFYHVEIASVVDNVIHVSVSEFDKDEEGNVVNPPEVGNDIVQFGNSVNKNRQSAIYIHADESAQPAIDIMFDIDSKDWTGKIKTRLGGDIPGGDGARGFYCENGMIKGTDTSGHTVYCIHPDGTAEFGDGSAKFAADRSGCLAGGAISWVWDADKNKFVCTMGDVILKWDNLDPEVQENLKGEKGDTGEKGGDGTNGMSVYITYNDSESQPEKPTGNGTSNGWHTDATSTVMWMSQKVAASVSSGSWGTPIKIKGGKGDIGPQGVPGPAGKDGKVYYTWIKYADDAQGNGISNDPAGKSFIGLAYNKESETESNTASDYSWSRFRGFDGSAGKDGKDGTDGVPGPAGEDGKTTYTWIAYSDNADGSGMYQVPTDTTKYIGIAVNKDTATESDNPVDYTWSQFRGENAVLYQIEFTLDGILVTNLPCSADGAVKGNELKATLYKIDGGSKNVYSAKEWGWAWYLNGEKVMEFMAHPTLSQSVSFQVIQIADIEYDTILVGVTDICQASISKMIANVPDWVKDWDTNKVQIGSEYMISPKLFTGKNTGTAEEPILTGIVQGDNCLTINGETKSGFYGIKENEIVFSIDSDTADVSTVGDVIANAIKATGLNVNDKFKVDKDGIVSSKGSVFDGVYVEGFICSKFSTSFDVDEYEYPKTMNYIVNEGTQLNISLPNDDKYIGAIMTVFLNRNLSSEGMIIGGNVSYNGKRITPLIKNKGTILRLMATYKVNNDLYWEVINFDNRNFALVNLTAVEGSNILFLLDRTTSANPDKSMSGTLKELSDYWDTI